MPYIKKTYDNSNCAAAYSTASATEVVPNITGTTYNMVHYTAGSKNIYKAVCDLLDEANIPYSTFGTYGLEIWGVKFVILQIVQASSTGGYGSWMLSAIPYGSCYYPVASSNGGRGGSAACGRYVISSTYFCWWNGNDSNHVGFSAYLYYNDNYICFRLRENENVGGHTTPFFYICKGTTIDGHNCAIMGGSPSGNSTICRGTDYGGAWGFGYRHEFFDLDDPAHTFGTAYRTSDVSLSPFPNCNVGTFGNDYLVDNLVLKPVSDWCMNGYVKMDNMYYVDYFLWNRDMLEDRIVEINGEQYYIPRRQVLQGTDAYRALDSTHPVALKL